MTDAERAVFERRIKEELEKAWDGISATLLRLLGDPPNVNNVPDSFWSATLAATLRAVGPSISELAQAEARAARTEAEAQVAGIAVNWTVINQSAADWAGQYSYELVKGITEHSREKLAGMVNSFFETPRQDLKGLGEEIAKIFGPGRGEMIATTEVTRAAAEGELLTLRQLRKDNPNLRYAEFWVTSNDEIVCPVCQPLNGVQGDGRGNFESPEGGVYRLPAHPRCRCARRTELVLRGQRG